MSRMMSFSLLFALIITLTTSSIYASPVKEETQVENESSISCDYLEGYSLLHNLVDPVQFCSRYIQAASPTVILDPILPTKTFSTMTQLVTVTSGTPKTSYVFLQGEPQRQTERLKNRNINKDAVTIAETVAACSCLLNSKSPPRFVPFNVVKSTVTVTPDPTTKTVYPCASASTSGTRAVLPSPGPGYGLSNYLLNLKKPSSPRAGQPPGLANRTINNLFPLSSDEGQSSVSCCNTCFFGIENCAQAFWYSYQGCVVMQVKNSRTSKRDIQELDLSENSTPLRETQEKRGKISGKVPPSKPKPNPGKSHTPNKGSWVPEGRNLGSSFRHRNTKGNLGFGQDSPKGGSFKRDVRDLPFAVCPDGLIAGLIYGPDSEVTFRSSGNIAGPCGEGYTEL